MDSGIFFIDNNDIEAVKSDDINFDLQLSQKKSNTDDLRARIYAHQYIKATPKIQNLKPFGVSRMHLEEESWKGYKVLLTGDKTSKSVVLQVCFPFDNKENFAIVLESGYNKSCEEKIKKIEKLKIVDDQNTERMLKKKAEEKEKRKVLQDKKKEEKSKLKEEISKLISL